MLGLILPGFTLIASLVALTFTATRPATLSKETMVPRVLSSSGLVVSPQKATTCPTMKPPNPRSSADFRQDTGSAEAAVGESSRRGDRSRERCGFKTRPEEAAREASAGGGGLATAGAGSTAIGEGAALRERPPRRRGRALAGVALLLLLNLLHSQLATKELEASHRRAHETLCGAQHARSLLVRKHDQICSRVRRLQSSTRRGQRGASSSRSRSGHSSCRS